MVGRQPFGRWWQSRKTWLIGVPVGLLLAVIGLFGWGSLQAKPAGFAPIERAIAVETAVETESEVAQTQLYTLDATGTDDWVFFDFTTGAVLEQGDFSAVGWDVAFQRTKLLTNSGVTNPAGPGGAVDLGEVSLEVDSVPAVPQYAVDVLGGEDDDEPENPAVGKWYSYSFISHTVSTKPNTYLIRTGETHDALVQFDSYYCEDEEPGCITFRYLLVPGSG